MELPKREVDPNVGKRESSTRKMKTTRMMRKMTTLADLRVVLRRERRVPGIKKTLVLRTPSTLLGNLPKKRVRSLEKAENPSKRRDALKRHPSKK